VKLKVRYTQLRNFPLAS